MSGHNETSDERAARQKSRADAVRPNVSLTPGQAETLRKARRRSALLRLTRLSERVVGGYR